jgi:hypothetical protein
VQLLWGLIVKMRGKRGPREIEDLKILARSCARNENGEADFLYSTGHEGRNTNIHGCLDSPEHCPH